MERREEESDRRLYLGVAVRMLLVGPAIMLALVLPPVAPFHWWAVGGAIALFSVLGLLAAVATVVPTIRRSRLATVGAVLVAHAAAGLAIVASQDPATTVSLGVFAAMAFQLSVRRDVAYTVLSWVSGSCVYVVAQAALDVPTEHLVARGTIFAGITAVLLATFQFLVGAAYTSRSHAFALARLARAAATAKTLPDGVRAGEEAIRELTGADQVMLRFDDSDLSEQPGSTTRVMPIGTSSGGAVNLALVGARSTHSIDVIVDLLAQLCERDRVLGELVRHSRTDPVTGVSNRRVLDEAIAAGDGAGARSVVMIDLDRFKDFNDRHGHLAGDELLGRFARILEEHVRPGDHVARYGGEEFCLVLEADVDVARSVVERVRQTWTHQQEAVTFSAGIAGDGPGVSQREDPALARADRALYEAKDAGRNCTVVDGWGVVSPGDRP